MSRQDTQVLNLHFMHNCNFRDSLDTGYSSPASGQLQGASPSDAFRPVNGETFIFIQKFDFFEKKILKNFVSP